MLLWAGRLQTGGWLSDEWAELWGAESPQELLKVLVRERRQRTPNHPEVMSLLRKHHGEGQQGTFDSALLICTDRRWERCTTRVIADIAASGLLGEEDLNRLAHTFLWDDKVLYDYPARWVGSKLLEIDTESGKTRVVRVPPKTPLRHEAPVQPPLRRWAAARTLTQQPGRFAVVLERARSLDPPSGAAVVKGMLDAIDSLAPEDAAATLDVGLSWPLGSVRLQALKLLAARQGPEPAVRRAATDPDAGVRAWVPGPRKVKRARSGPEAAARRNKAAADPAERELSWQENLFFGD